MSARPAPADDVRGMPFTTAPEPGRSRAHLRLCTDLETLGRLDPERTSAANRLETVLGGDLARRLVGALTKTGRPTIDVVAA